MTSDTPRTYADVHMTTLSLKSDAASWWAHTEIHRLRAELSKKIEELAAMKQQRDEARREICDLKSTPRWNAYFPIATARRYAEERGWDCYAQEGGAA